MTDRIDLLHGLVSSAAAEVPDRAAIISPDGSSVTFAQFDAQVGSVAGWVSERTRRGDRIAVIADNGAAYARLYYGVPRGGRILTLINQRLSAGEQTIQLASAEPTILAGDAGYLDALPRISEHIPSIEHVVAFDDPEWQRAEHESTPAEHRTGADGDAAILATAGRPHDEVRIRIADDGEILVRGAQVAAGYWPANAPVSVDGWLHTGGENVSSREVEDALSSHADVDQVAPVGGGTCCPRAVTGRRVQAPATRPVRRVPAADQQRQDRERGCAAIRPDAIGAVVR